MSTEQRTDSGVSRGAEPYSCHHFARLRDVEVIANSNGWATSMRQLEPGPLRLDGVVVAVNTATVLDVAVSHRVEIRGRTQSGTVAVVLPQRDTRLWLNGYEQTSTTAMAIPPGSTISAWSREAARLSVALMPAALPVLERYFCREDARALASGEALRAYSARPGDVLEKIATTFCTPERADAHGDDGETTHWRSAPNPARDRGSFQVICRAVDHIDANLGGPISSTDLTVAAASSLSKLERTFRQEIGLTPSEYIRARRLSAARKELRSGYARQVAAVAFDNGFRHLGRFSGAYRQFFGELPSETLSVTRRLPISG